MSSDALQLLATFTSLPPDEQRLLAAEIARVASSDGGGLSFDEQSRSADFVEGQLRVEADDDGLLPYEQWIAEFRQWARSHTVHNPDLDVRRESLYD